MVDTTKIRCEAIPALLDRLDYIKRNPNEKDALIKRSPLFSKHPAALSQAADLVTQGKTPAETLEQLKIGCSHQPKESEIISLEKGIKFFKQNAEQLKQLVNTNKLTIEKAKEELERYYQKGLLPFIKAEDKASFEQECLQLKDYIFIREEQPSYPTTRNLFELGVPSLSLGIGVYNLIASQADLSQTRWDFAGPILSRYSRSQEYLTDNERAQRAQWNRITDLALTISLLLPRGQTTPSDGPEPASETTYVPILTDYVLDLLLSNTKPANSDTLRFVNNSLVKIFKLDGLANLTTRELYDLGYENGHLTIPHDTVKGVIASLEGARERARNERTHQLSRVDGTCGDDAAAVDGLVAKYGISEEEAKRIHCASKTFNTSADAFGGINRALRLGSIYAANRLYLNANLAIDSAMFSLADGSESSFRNTALFAAARLLLNQAPNFTSDGTGWNNEQFGHDALLSSIAFAEAAMSRGNKDLPYSWAMANNLLAGAHFYPNYYLRLDNRAAEETDADPIFPVVYAAGAAADFTNQLSAGYFFGRELSRALKTGDDTESFKRLAPVLLAIGAQIGRGVYYQSLKEPDDVKNSSLSEAQVEKIQDEYRIEPQWSDLVMLGNAAAFFGLGALAFVSDETPADSSGSAGGVHQLEWTNGTENSNLPMIQGLDFSLLPEGGATLKWTIYN